MVCAQDIMYGDAKGKEVLAPDEAVDLIRKHIADLKTNGKLNPRYPDRFLLDIRGHLEKTRKLQSGIKAEANEKFSDLIQALRRRKLQLIEEVKANFATKNEFLKEEEEKWVEKDSIAKMLLSHSSTDDDAEIVKNSLDIVNGIRKLGEDSQVKDVEFLSSINSSIKLENRSETIEFSELLQHLENYSQFGQTTNMQFNS